MVIHRSTVDNYSYTETQAFIRTGATGLVGRVSVAFKEISLYKITCSRLKMLSQSSLYEVSRPCYDVSLIPTFILTLRRLMLYIYMEHPFLMFLDHTQRRSTVGGTPLDE